MKSLSLLLSLFFVITLSSTAQNWVEKSYNAPIERSNAVGFSNSNFGYVLLGVDANGNHLKDMWRYDPSTKKWTRVADFPGSARKNTICFTIGNYAYVGAGAIGVTGVRDMYRYDMTNDQWSTLVNYPGDGDRLQFNAACNGKAYVGGGRSGASDKRDFYEYSPATDNWRQLPNIPFGDRTSGISFTINDTVYFGLGYDGSQDHNDIWAYSVNDSTWTQKASLPGVGRVRASAVVINGKAIVGGGFRVSSSSAMLGDYYEYDPATNNWTSLTSNFVDSARAAFATFSLNNRAYVFGGSITRNGGTLLNDLWGYGNVGTINAWFKAVLTPPTARANPVGFSHGGYGYITTGNVTGGPHKKDFWKYDPLNDYWIPMPDFPGDARRNAMAFVIGNNAYVGAGVAGSTVKSDMYRFNFLTNQWSSINNYPGGNRLVFHAVHNGKAYAGGGVTSSGSGPLVNSFYEYNPSNDSWRQLPNLPFGNRSSGVSFTIADTVYFGMGYNGSQVLNDLWGYSVNDSTWSQKASFPGVGRARAGFIATNDGRAIVGGGINLSSAPYMNDYYIYDPTVNQWTNISNSFRDSSRAAYAMFSINNSAFIFAGTTNNVSGSLGDLWEYNLVSTGLHASDAFEQKSLSIFPNPSEGIFYSNVKEVAVLRVYSLNGKLVYEETIRPNSQIDLRALKTSTYLFVITGANSTESGKIVISK